MKKCAVLVLLMVFIFTVSGCGRKAEQPVTDDSETSGDMESDRKESSGRVFLEPPALTVVNGESSIKVKSGSYSWTVMGENGSAASSIACGAHPLDLREYLEELELETDCTAYLRFESSPDKVSAHCWSVECWGDTGAEAEPVDVAVRELLDGGSSRDYILQLKSGGYIYEVTAEWSRFEKYRGTASYCFCTAEPTAQK